MKLKKMKTIVMCLCLVTAMSACFRTQTGYTITGQLEGMHGTKFLFTDGAGKKERPSPVVVDEDGSFEISGSYEGDGVFMASLVSFNINTAQGSQGGASIGGPLHFAVQNGDNIRITSTKDNLKWATVTGNKYNEHLNEFRKLVKKNKVEIVDMLTDMGKLVKNNADENKINQKKEKIAALQKKTNQMVLDFIKQDPDEVMNAFVLKNVVAAMAYEEYNEGYQSLSDEVKASEWGQTVHKYLAFKKNVKATAVGQMAKDFEKVDKEGNLIRLSDFRGKKYVLLDFWGSWCAPCRAGHPHLKDLYAKYKDEGLEIIGIADERTRDGRERWLKAIEEDGIPWLQILNNEGKEKTDVVELYGITVFPTKILIDKEGRIILNEKGGTMAGKAKGSVSGAVTGTSSTSAVAAKSTGSSGSNNSGAMRFNMNSSADSSSAATSSGAASKNKGQANSNTAVCFNFNNLGGLPNLLATKKQQKVGLDDKLKAIFEK